MLNPNMTPAHLRALTPHELSNVRLMLVFNRDKSRGIGYKFSRGKDERLRLERNLLYAPGGQLTPELVHPDVVTLSLPSLSSDDVKDLGLFEGVLERWLEKDVTTLNQLFANLEVTFKVFNYVN